MKDLMNPELLAAISAVLEKHPRYAWATLAAFSLPGLAQVFKAVAEIVKAW